jgi:isocitrate/isopropylmalate dehydrogenase
LTKKVCVIKGDDASPEVVVPTVQVLEGMGLDIEFTWPLTGDEAVAEFGSEFPASAKQAIDEADCAIMGSTRSLTGPHGYLRWGKRGRIWKACIRGGKETWRAWLHSICSMR